MFKARADGSFILLVFLIIIMIASATIGHSLISIFSHREKKEQTPIIATGVAT
jgi:hypothetical protein